MYHSILCTYYKNNHTHCCLHDFRTNPMHRETQLEVNARYSPKLATLGVECAGFTLASGCGSQCIDSFGTYIQLFYHTHPQNNGL